MNRARIKPIVILVLACFAAAPLLGRLGRLSRSTRRAQPPAHAAPVVPAVPSAATPVTPPVALLQHDRGMIQAGDHPVSVLRFRAPLATTRIAVFDLHYTTALADALGDAELVVNGGYWAKDAAGRHIHGLLIENGRELSPVKPQLGGGVLWVQGGIARLVKTEDFHETGAALAVQCNPRLVAEGRVIDGLDDSARAARTALCIRDAGRTLEVYLTDPGAIGPTLSELGTYLVAAGCSDALNLDGGPSTAAAWRTADAAHPEQLGAGVELPYALRFSAIAQRN